MSESDLAYARTVAATALGSAVIGVLIGFQDEGRTPLVVFPGQLEDAAVPACAICDLHGEHIGRQVVLLFEGSDPRLPIIVGCLNREEGWPAAKRAAAVEVDTDGRRLVITAQKELVMRCGQASITLTSDGKVLIQGTYVSQRSSGVMRIKGGSVQLN
jgi:hypothetical protein